MTWLRPRRDGLIDHVHALRRSLGLAQFHTETTTIANTAAMATYAPNLIWNRCLDGGWIIAHGRHPMKRVAHWCLIVEAIAGRRVERGGSHGQNGQRAVDQRDEG